VRVESKTISIAAVTPNRYTTRPTTFEHWQTDPFIRTGVSIVTS